jgi:hypothetical protein
MPNTLLRHTLATVAYRGGKAIRDVPADFGSFRAGPSSRSAGEILAHIGDLFDWAYHLANGEHIWRDVAPTTWAADVGRFHAGLARLDIRLADARRWQAKAVREF